MNIFLRSFSPSSIYFSSYQKLHNSAIWRKVVQFKLSDIGEGIAEVQVKEWHVKVGDQVNEFDEICAVQSDKASVTITSRYSGTIRKLYFQPDDIAKVGQPLIDIEVPEISDSEDAAEIKSEEKNDMPEPVGNMASSLTIEAQRHSNKILASPAVRRLIREHDLKPTEIEGTGPNRRVLKEDILKMIQTSMPASRRILGSTTSKTKDQIASSSSSEDESDVKIVPIRGYNRAMIKTMTESLAIPHFGFGDAIIADELIKARELLAPIAKQKAIKLSYMPFIIKATSLALKEFPVLNSSLDQGKENIILKMNHNICFAMDTPDGLAVPNIKNCQKKSIWEIAMEMNKLMERGKARQFTKDDLSDGTFSISNIGSIGGTFLSPVILPPQVAIGAFGKIRKVPYLEDEGDDEYEPTVGTRNMMNIFWAADHRVIDGATLARFSNRFKQFLESPPLFFSELR